MIQVPPQPHGLILDKIGPEDYIFGAGKIAGDMVNPSGDWTDYLPNAEYQDLNRLETYNCTGFGTGNALETLQKKKYDIKANFSDRYVGTMAGTTKYGNSPHTVIETIRNYAGLIPEEELPFSPDIDTLEEYYSGVSWSLKMKGLTWLKQWEVKHEWVFDQNNVNKREAIIDALKFSPLGVSVAAWTKRGSYYVSEGEDNHWVTLYKATKNCYLIFDSYDKEVKKLAPDFNFGMAKRYSIEPRKSVDTQFMIRATRGLFGLY